MTVYIHQLPDWPLFRWNCEALSGQFTAVRHRQGRLVGRMESLGFSLRTEAVLQTLTLDVLKSSEIEGETPDHAITTFSFLKNEVRSSLARHLGIDIGGLVPTDRNVDGAVEMKLDAKRNYYKPMTKERLFGWHGALFPAGYSGMSKIIVGAWRKEPTQVTYGPTGRQRVLFETPAAERLEDEMAAFLNWFNSEDDTDPVLRAGIAHLWFVTIHPFDDGNGRIALALSDMLLARSEQSGQRFYSMSAQIRQERKGYYEMLEHAQKGTLDITEPLRWFLGCMDRAFDNAERMLADVLRKARFWNDCGSMPLNDRQRLIMNKLLDGFEGKLTSTKWAKLAKCSQHTATRDINDLVNRAVLKRDQAGGRSTSYSLVSIS
jgi:Fic family protein